MDTRHLVINLLQALLLIFGAPLVRGLIAKIKARFQNRIGASILQPYFDIYKMLQKESVISDTASWLTIGAPFVSFIAFVVGCFFLPVVTTSAAAGFIGDAIAFV